MSSKEFYVVGGTMTTICSLLVPSYANSNTVLFNPFTHFIHRKAATCKTEIAKRCTFTLLYLSKPLDRAIQAIAAPIFNILSHFTLIGSHYKLGNYKRLVSRIILTPVMVPYLLIKGIIDSLGLLINGAIQLAFPYQMFYAMKKGAEATPEYSDCRSHMISNLANSHFELLEKIATQGPKKPISCFIIVYGNHVTDIWGTTQWLKDHTQQERVERLRKLLYF